jgi:hypothetical protein
MDGSLEKRSQKQSPLPGSSVALTPETTKALIGQNKKTGPMNVRQDETLVGTSIVEKTLLNPEKTPRDMKMEKPNSLLPA